MTKRLSIIIGICLLLCTVTFTAIRYRFIKSDSTIDPIVLMYEIDYLDLAIVDILNNPSVPINTLPNGKKAGSIYAQSDNGRATLYIATEATVGAQSWMKVGSQ